MLPGEALSDRIRRGLGRAGRGAGAWCDLFRPHGPAHPMAVGNRILRLPAAFVAPRDPTAPVVYGQALWEGIFDAGYTQPGDYLRGPDGLFFIASQPRLGPVLCVKTNRVLTLARPAAQTLAGLNRYGGVQAREATPLMTCWPASVLGSRRDEGRGALPSDAPGVPSGGTGGWEILMPGTPGVLLRMADLATDDFGRAAVLGSTELTALGWRLYARQAGT
jgi:hypothetical protein